MKRQFVRTCLALLAMMFAMAPALCMGQSVNNEVNVGLPDNAQFHGSDIENVQVNNGNLHIDIPMWQEKGRGLDTAYHFIYDSKGWSVPENCDQLGDCSWRVTAEPGNTMILKAYGPTSYQLTKKTTNYNCNNVYRIVYSNYVLREPDGTKHHFVPDPFQSTSSPYCAGYPGASVLYADDGSGWTIAVGTWTATDKHGMAVLLNNGIEDSNGNKVNTTDTLGRAISTTGSYYDSTGNQRSFVTSTTTVPIQTNLCQFGSDPCTEYIGTWTVPQQITLPNGQVYTFTYAQNAGGEVQSITLPDGGEINYSYGNPDSGGRWVTSRTVQTTQNSGTWTYTAPVGHNYMVVTDPGGNDAKYTCSYPMPANDVCEVQSVQDYQGSYSSGTLLKTVNTDYQTFQMFTGQGGANSYVALPIRDTTTWNQYNLVSKTETDWDSSTQVSNFTLTWKNPVEQRYYDWGVGSPGSLLKRTHYSYLHLDNPGTYLTANIADRVTSIVTYDGQSNVMAQSLTSYDGSSLTASSSVPNHDYTKYSNTYLVRGNPTQVGVWNNQTNSWFNTVNTYNDLGNLLSTTDPGQHTTTFSYSDSWASVSYNCAVGTNTNAYVTQRSAPDTTNQQGATVHHRSQTTYFPCTGQSQSVRDENDILASRTGTSYTYDSMFRPLTVAYMDGGQTSYGYTDTANSVSITKSDLLDSSHTIQNVTYLDGLGRVMQTKLVDPGDGDAYVDMTYDNLGRVVSVSNPHRSSPLSTDGTTTFQYDALGRKVLEIPPDGSASANNVQTTYAVQNSVPIGLTTTLTDEAGHKRMTVADGLGRLVEVWEPDPASGSLVNATIYQYDALSNLLCVEQHGNVSGTGCSSNPSYDSSSPWRVRRFTYDSLSRLLTAKNPESGTYTWTYDSDSNVLTKTDNRGFVINYSPAASPIDQLHRVTQKTYTNGDPIVNYYYDQTSYDGLAIVNGVGHQTGMSDGTGMAAWTFDSEGRKLQETRTINISGVTPSAVTKNLGYAYNLDGSLKSLTYPSGHRVDYSYYPSGQLNYSAGRQVQAIDSTSSVTNYVTSATYAPHGEVASLINGVNGSFPGVSTTNAWNSRLQPSIFSASTQGSGSRTVLSLSFNFNLGVQDNGLLLKINNNLQTGRSTNYQYDQLNRITGAWHDATDWGTIYGIDIWANLNSKAACTVAICGATKTSNDSLTAAANQYNYLVGYPYDAVGNITNDLLGHTYSYDAENRPYSAGGVNYYYDGEGERVAKSNGKLYLFGTGSAPAVETDANGNTTAEYVFFDGKRTARIDPQVDVRFTNDSCSACNGGTPVGGGDRNLFVSYIAVGSTTIYPSDSSVTYTPQGCNGPVGGVGQLLCNGDMVSTNAALLAGQSITVNAYGSPDYNVYPHMQILVSGVVVGEWDVTGSSQSYTVNVPGRAVHYYFGDQIGSASVVTNANGSVTEQDIEYHPYGEEQVYTDTLGQEYRFTGKEHDPESNNDYFVARYYSSTLGRFMTPDWSAVPDPVPYAHLGMPQTLNLYSYVENNPVTGIDPDGHDGPATSTTTPAETSAAESAAVDAEESAVAAEAEESAAGGVVGIGLAGVGIVIDSFTLRNYVEAKLKMQEQKAINDVYIRKQQQQQAQKKTSSAAPQAAHRSKIRPSTKGKHQQGTARLKKDHGSEKADWKPDGSGSRRPPRKRPPGYPPKGPWPPKPPEAPKPPEKPPTKK